MWLTERKGLGPKWIRLTGKRVRCQIRRIVLKIRPFEESPNRRSGGPSPNHLDDAKKLALALENGQEASLTRTIKALEEEAQVSWVFLAGDPSQLRVLLQLRLDDAIITLPVPTPSSPPLFPHLLPLPSHLTAIILMRPTTTPTTIPRKGEAKTRTTRSQRKQTSGRRHLRNHLRDGPNRSRLQARRREV